MTTPPPPADWPTWVTKDQIRRLHDLSLRFTWLVTKEATEASPSVLGQWTCGVGPEINVALRETGTSLVGIYRRGQGFWPGDRSPALVTPQRSFTGPLGEVLDKAVAWATQERAAR